MGLGSRPPPSKLWVSPPRVHPILLMFYTKWARVGPLAPFFSLPLHDNPLRLILLPMNMCLHYHGYGVELRSFCFRRQVTEAAHRLHRGGVAEVSCCQQYTRWHRSQVLTTLRGGTWWYTEVDQIGYTGLHFGGTSTPMLPSSTWSSFELLTNEAFQEPGDVVVMSSLRDQTDCHILR